MLKRSIINISKNYSRNVSYMSTVSPTPETYINDCIYSGDLVFFKKLLVKKHQVSTKNKEEIEKYIKLYSDRKNNIIKRYDYLSFTSILLVNTFVGIEFMIDLQSTALFLYPAVSSFFAYKLSIKTFEDSSEIYKEMKQLSN